MESNSFIDELPNPPVKLSIFLHLVLTLTSNPITTLCYSDTLFYTIALYVIEYMLSHVVTLIIPQQY